MSRTRRSSRLSTRSRPAHRAQFSRSRGPLFLSESRRNHGEPLSLWTWSKVVRRVALAADVPRALFVMLAADHDHRVLTYDLILMQATRQKAGPVYSRVAARTAV